MRFKIGDYVEVTEKDFPRELIGSRGVITYDQYFHMYTAQRYYQLKFDYDEEIRKWFKYHNNKYFISTFNAEELKLVDEHSVSIHTDWTIPKPPKKWGFWRRLLYTDRELAQKEEKGL